MYFKYSCLEELNFSQQIRFIRSYVLICNFSDPCPSGFKAYRDNVVVSVKHIYLYKQVFSCLYLSLSEAASRSCSMKKVFLKVLQNLQENTCAKVFF